MTLFYVDFLFSLEIIKLALRDHDQQGTIEGACICRISIWASLGHKHMKDKFGFDYCSSGQARFNGFRVGVQSLSELGTSPINDG